ncbi:MAG: sigma-70 family RNA polymerase sigma factor, partial [Chloroflexaceae bacterium]
MTDSDDVSQAFPPESENEPLPSPNTTRRSSAPGPDQETPAIPPGSDDDPRVRRLLAAYAPGLIEHLRARLDDLWSGDLATQVAPAIRAEADANRSLDVVTPEPPLALRRSVSERVTVFCLRAGLTSPALVLLLDYVPRIKLALKRSKHGPYLSAEDLEDVAQDTIVRAVERGAQYRPELSSLGSWLNMMAHFAMLDLIRERSALSLAGREQIAGEQLSELGEGTPEFDEQMGARVQQAVHALSPGLALYIQRRFLEGWSDAEIQSKMNVKAGTLRVWKKRALDRLRAILGSSLGPVLVLLIATVGPVVAHLSFEAPGVGSVAQAPGLTPSPIPTRVSEEAPPLPTATATAAPLVATPTTPLLAPEPGNLALNPAPTEGLAAPSATTTPAASPTPPATATLLTLPSPTVAPPHSDRPLPPTATARPELQLSITPIRAPAPVLEEIPAAPTEAAAPTAVPEPEMTATATASPTPSPTATATASPTLSPTATATASPTLSPTATATASPTPS